MAARLLLALLWLLQWLPLGVQAWLGRGIGAKLLALGEDWLRAAGVNVYNCFVHRGNDLGKRFYLSQGFEHRPERDRGDEWYMEKRL